MPAAAAATPAKEDTPVAEAVPAPRLLGKKKLLIIIAAVAATVVILAGAGAGYYFLKVRPAAQAQAAQGEEAEEAAEEDAAEQEAASAEPLEKPTLKNAPTFVPLDMFTVNLADRDSERYAQIGLSLELTDAKSGELLKAYMPAIRNNILLVLANKTAAELMDPQGKLQLASELRAAALKPLGYDIKPKAGRPAADEEDPPPVRAVHFSNFIIQ